MRNIFLPLFLLPVLLQAQGFIQWQKPVEKPCHTENAHHGGHGKAPRFQISGHDAAKAYDVTYISSTLESRPLTPENGIVTIPSTGYSNYHALVVNHKDGKRVSSAVRYIYAHGRPSKTSPSKLTHMSKSILEIVPSPLPREHDRYTGSKTYRFELLFNGKPLAGRTVTLHTNNGSEFQVSSDKDGEFKITLPNDFTDVKTGRRGNKPAEFMLQASYTADDTEYATTLSMPYHVNPNDYWRSETIGAILILLGFIIGFVLMRRYVTTKRKA